MLQCMSFLVLVVVTKSLLVHILSLYVGRIYRTLSTILAFTQHFMAFSLFSFHHRHRWRQRQRRLHHLWHISSQSFVLCIPRSVFHSCTIHIHTHLFWVCVCVCNVTFVRLCLHTDIHTSFTYTTYHSSFCAILRAFILLTNLCI